MSQGAGMHEKKGVNEEKKSALLWSFDMSREPAGYACGYNTNGTA